MRIGNFSVLIPQGREHGSGHVGMTHGQVYGIRLGNHGNLRCDAVVEIDGKDCGTYRIDPHSDWTLERAHHDRGRFTFFKTDSVEASISVGILKEDRGLVQVTFKPEKRWEPPKYVAPPSAVRGGGGAAWNAPKGLCGAAGPIGAAEGITGLTGHSNQNFVEAHRIDYDPDGTVVITLRLVEDSFSQAIRKLEPVPRGNPTPSPVS